MAVAALRRLPRRGRQAAARRPPPGPRRGRSDPLGLAGEQALLGLHHGDLSPEPGQRLAHLHPHRSAAQDQRARRHFLHSRDLAVGPEAVEALEAIDGGNAGAEPVAITIRSVSYSVPSTSTLPGPAILPVPWISSIPRSSSHGRYPESSQLETTSLRHSSDSATSSSPVTARRAPQARLAAATVSPGQQGLGGHASPERALPGDQLALDDRDPLHAPVGEFARADLARRAAPITIASKVAISLPSAPAPTRLRSGVGLSWRLRPTGRPPASRASS